MALDHASVLAVISVRPLGAALADAVSTSLLRTDRVQLLHLVLPRWHQVPQRSVDHTCVLHCLEGQVDVQLTAGERRLAPGELVVLPPHQPYGLLARADTTLLMTLLHHPDDRAAAATPAHPLPLPFPPAAGRGRGGDS